MTSVASVLSEAAAYRGLGYPSGPGYAIGLYYPNELDYRAGWNVSPNANLAVIVSRRSALALYVGYSRLLGYYSEIY